MSLIPEENKQNLLLLDVDLWNRAKFWFSNKIAKV